jgi:hypothetical protein
VYGGLLRQWASLNSAVYSKIFLLESICKANYIKSMTASIRERTSVQCASNEITVSLSVTTSGAYVPSGSVLTFVGLNSEEPLNGLQIQSSPPSIFESVVWLKPVCSRSCLPSKQCSASWGCKASSMPSGCCQLCDRDAVLQVTVKESFQNTTLSLIVDNSCSPSCLPPQVLISVSGPEFFVPNTTVKQTSPVLTSQDLPTFSIVNVVEDDPDNYDPSAKQWRGAALGQRNTITFSLLSSLDVYTGSNVTITGFKASLSLTSQPPSVRKLASLITDLIVDAWEPSSGTVVLRVSSKTDGPVAVANKIFSFGLEIDMPISAVLALKSSPVMTIEASGLGSRRSCCCSVARMEFSTQVLVPRPSAISFFAAREISQSTCFPGECNTLTATIAVNTAVTNPVDNLFLIITGLNGMNLDSVCSPSCNIAESIISLQDAIPGPIFFVSRVFLLRSE